MPGGPVLEARSVTVQYPGTKALDGVTFALRAGAVSALIAARTGQGSRRW